MLDISNCYKLLHLDEDCSDLELRRRYRKCALESHPDRINSEVDSASAAPFIRFNEAYRRIVHYRKHQMRQAAARAPTSPSNENLSGKHLLSFEQLRKKLYGLNCGMMQNPPCKAGDSFSSEINRIYEEHMSILESLSERLRKMQKS